MGKAKDRGFSGCVQIAATQQPKPKKRSRSADSITRPAKKRTITAMDKLNEVQLRSFQPWYRLGRESFATWREDTSEWDVDWMAMYKRLEPTMRAENLVRQYKTYTCTHAKRRFNPATGQTEMTQHAYAEACEHPECKRLFTPFYKKRIEQVLHDEKHPLASDCPLQVCIKECRCAMARKQKQPPIAQSLEDEDRRRMTQFRNELFATAARTVHDFWDRRYAQAYREGLSRSASPEEVLKSFWTPSDTTLRKTRQQLLQFYNTYDPYKKPIQYVTLEFDAQWAPLDPMPYFGCLL